MENRKTSEVIRINGGNRLRGDVTVHGAKNSALPLLAATLIAKGTTTLHNCPRLSDVDTSMEILRHLGCDVVRQDDAVTVRSDTVSGWEIPDEWMRRMRSSIVFLGAMIARCREATLTYPGGCELGPRPIDLHLYALQKLGVTVEEQHGRIHCCAQDGLHGADITLAFPSVGATENTVLAACTAQGTTVIRHAAREPEIADLCRYLNRCGARIRDDRSGTLYIEGVSALHGCDYTVMPDRIEAVTYLAAAAVTGGSVTLRHGCPSEMTPVLPVWEQAGCTIKTAGDDMTITAPAFLNRLGTVRTMPYPGFPTDAGAPVLAAACLARGTSIFAESIFENRYRYVSELTRMGANIYVDGRVAVVEGVSALQGASVSCTDLRGGAALVVAALAANGETVISDLHHLDRGYENLVDYLRQIGADMERTIE